MIDFGIFLTLRELISQKKIGEKFGFGRENVYMVAPPSSPKNWPIVFFELEELWTFLKMSKMEAHSQIKFKTSVLSENEFGNDAIEIAQKLAEEFDGKIIDVENGKIAILKLCNSVIDFKKNKNEPRKVEQYYEALIRLGRE